MSERDERVFDPGADRVGTDLAFRNVSGEVRMVNNTVRPAQSRDATGKWKPRESRIIGPLNVPSGPGGVDAVTGRWIPGVRNNAQLHDWERTHAVTTSPYFSTPDWGESVPMERKSNAGLMAAEQRLNHHLGSHHEVPSADCPDCANLSDRL